MSCLRDRVKQILRSSGIHPMRRIGQNFVIDESIFDRMIGYADLRKEDTVLEVGAGFGFLTERLVKICSKVIAVEIDKRLVRFLEKRFKNLPNVELIHGDILKVDVPHFNKVVATPPYSISSNLIFWLLDRKFNVAVLTLQDEFAKRLYAPVGSKDYCRLTVMVYYRAEVKGMDKVPRNSFYPQPKVDSRIVIIKHVRTPFKVKNYQFYKELVNVLFTQRNRKVRNALISFMNKRSVAKSEARKIADSISFSNRRVRTLAPEDLGMLSDELLERMEKLNLR